MAGGGPQAKAERRSRAVVAVVVLLLLGAGGVAFFMQPGPVPASAVVPAPVVATVPARPVEALPAVEAAVPAGPSFDIVRVSPAGQAVIAGRAAPGAEVVVRDGATEIARAQADRQGAFVAIPAVPLAEGGRALTLAARTPDGSETRGDGTVMVVVPPVAVAPVAVALADPVVPQEPPAAPGALAVLVPGAGAPRVLQQGQASAMGLDAVDYDESGAIRFTGHAAAGSAMRVYVDNRPVGDAAADAGGRWVLMPGEAVAPGVHTLRVDRLDAAGRVLARVELPFQRAAFGAAELAGSAAGGRVVVQPGQNLWRLARSAYGSGVRYTTIYLANREAIRDPRLIYPGQAFSVPATP